MNSALEDKAQGLLNVISEDESDYTDSALYRLVMRYAKELQDELDK